MCYFIVKEGKMKKYLNVAVSAIVAALAFVWFALPFMTFGPASINGYQMITFEGGQFKTILFSLCAIALLVVSLVVLVVALLNLLNKLNVLKVNVNAKLNRILLIVAAVLAVVCLILIITELGNGIGLGAGLILAAVTYVAAVVCNFLVKED